MLLKKLFNLTLATAFAAYLGYTNAGKINKFVNHCKYAGTEAEVNFIDKDRSIDLKIERERNGNGNLETYLRVYSDMYPIYSRKNGLMVGDPNYNFSNFTQDEKSDFCSGETVGYSKRKSSEPKTRSLFGKFYEVFLDEWPTWIWYEKSC